ncbi:DUF5131 family protein [Symbiobacterium terraclitae]|uniref:DUF5131 family protein n=1 Tax=Symbiobacterium terraclitae TaxID=557451 RepID=UPI0035B505DC
MADRTSIEWTDATWNPIRGCSRVSEGCRNCYAERQAIRFAGAGQPYEGLVRSTDHGPRWTGQVRLAEELLEAPLRWRKPRRVFVNSMSDLFHEALPFSVIAAIYGVMALTPRHTYQVLTKRPQRAVEFFHWLDRAAEVAEVTFPEDSINWRRWHILRAAAIRFLGTGPLPGIPADDPPWPLPNVWIGVSVENQAAADERIPYLLQTPAAVRFVSCEPLLGPVDLTAVRPDAYTVLDVLNGCGVTTRPAAMGQSVPNVWTERLDWVVVGGETGPGARPMHPDWVRSIRDACVAAGVPFFFKQWGEYCYPSQMSSDTWQQVDMAINLGHHSDSPIGVGKRLAGALLDGREWREWPVVAAR